MGNPYIKDGHGSCVLLRAESLTKAYGPKEVIKSATLQLNRGIRLGLVGRNGAGKTTLIRLLMGQLGADTGELTVKTEKIGYLPQFLQIEKKKTVKDLVGSPYGRLARIVNRMSRIEESMAQGEPGTDWEALAAEYSALEEEYASVGGHESASKGRGCLSKVGLSDTFYKRKLETLSGGELTKAMLARVLLQAEEADILFLDEP
ncbi:MAG TPA: ABC-F family ATP-binding cassette domain-containing protein, partial [Euryarchaeota archaeon]|nr:ABC-F family ATP-binding cassette domain-containing protein [Euryarchaeota archaeon]